MKNGAAIFTIIVVIMIAIGAFFAIKTFKSPNSTLPFLQTQNTQQPTQLVGVRLSLKPESQTAPAVGNTIRYIAGIESSAQLAGVQTTIHFDPKGLSIESVEAGSLFTKPEILTNVIDSENGTISYSVGTFSPALASGELFIVTAKVLKSGSSRVTFDQTKTKVGLISTTTQRPFSENETQVTFEENSR